MLDDLFQVRTTCVSRKRINDVFDAILYKLFYSNANTTQEEAVIRRRRKSTPSKYIKRVHDRLSLKIGDLAL